MRFRGWFAAAACCLMCTAGLAAPAPVSLRGYGRVTATFGPERARFACESAAKADVLLGKLLADLFWDAPEGAAAGVTLKVAGRAVPARVWPPYGALAVAAAGSEVLAVGAETPERLAAALAGEPFFRRPGLRFRPAKPYPRYLDFYDLRALKSYTHAMSSPKGEGLPSHWPFVKRFGLGGLAFQGLGFQFQCPAPGVLELGPADYEVREAERQGGLIVPCPSGGGEVPLWAYNAAPGSTMQPSPTSLLGAWGGVAAAGAHFESWGTPPADKAATGLDYLRRVITRYRESPAVGGWGLYCGSPGAEMGFHDRTGELWDYSPAGQQGFRDWLRTVKGYDLAALGRRWYGDPAHFRRWEDVTVPDVRGFFGGLDASCLRITDGWQWRRVEGEGFVAPPDAGAPGWVPVAMPPAQEEGTLPFGEAFYRTRFDAAGWLAGKGGKDLYLVCDAGIRSPEGVGFWLNGEYLGRYQPKVSSTGPIGLKVTGLVKSGANDLVVRVPAGGGGGLSEGKLYGPVFLTTTLPRAYPYLGVHANARYVDLREWQAYGVYHSHLPVVQLARGLDPERPLILSPGSSWEVAGYAADLATRYGTGLQNTGREAYYHPWWTGLGLVCGFYGTSEPSATARGASLDRMLGWILVDGDSNHDLFWTLEDYIGYEKQTGWFTRNKRLLQCFGKALRVPPRIVILRSARTLLLGDEAPQSWDVGRGELQSAHYDNAYASEREVEQGLVDRFPVLLDSGTEFVDDRLLAAIERYVRRGGTFIALHHTGRHSLLEPDTYPISRLTGFRVAAAGRSGKIRFETKLPLFHGWEGREFEGEGLALDWMQHESARGAGLSLESSDASAEALARWEDGSVAIGCRTLGKGRVVTLGSTFWRSGRDVAGVWRSQSQLERAFLERLFTDLGVLRDADASNPDVWVRRFVTKNGLQQWAIAFNNGAGAAQSDVSFRAPARPAEVLDEATGRPVAFEYADGWVRLANVEFAPQGTRIFGIRRASLAGGLPTWWAEKTTYWRACPATPPPAAPAPAETISFERWRFLADRDGSVGAAPAWTAPGFDDHAWRWLGTGPWNLAAADLADYRGAGLYRARFRVPPAWAGRRVALCLYCFDNPLVYNHAEFFVNGARVTEYQARRWSQTLQFDVTDHLRPGDNVLAVRVDQGKEFAGLAAAVWLQAEWRLAPSLDLAGVWDAVGADYLARRKVALPGKARAKYLVRQVAIPASWAGRRVGLHLETPTQWLGLILVNGHPICYNSYLHLFGLRPEVDVTLYVQPGKENTIALWPNATVPGHGNPARAEEEQMEVTAIRIGCRTPESPAGKEAKR